MVRTRPALTGVAGAIALAGLLVGCGGDGDTSATTEVVATTDATGTTDVVATTDPVDTADPVETSDPEPEGGLAVGEATGSDPTTTESPSTTEAPAEGDCLIGDWVVTEEQMDAFYAGLMGTLEAPLTIDTVGSAPLSFAADGTYAWAPDFVLTVEVAGQSGTGLVGGTITGDWTTADGVVTTASDVNALTVSVTVNGVTFAGDDLANGLLNSSPINGATYSCDGPAPVLDFKTADPAVTVPVTLTPA